MSHLLFQIVAQLGVAESARESGFLKKLLPGSVVLADRGFDITDSEDVALMQASLEIPGFTKGMTQLNSLLLI